MWSWATLISLLISLALEIVKYLKGRGDYNTEKLADAIKHLEAVDVLVRNAQLASSRVDHSTDAILQDPDNRARQPDVEHRPGGSDKEGGV